ncbi:MAG: hypothetical protein O2955_08345 [Planctomycetota bacterium]|nr:hypothetical protein [Planctomycetota bacterium]MDA1212513.1 hypothetical protein [Planctomycetota bacterium]
MTWTQSAVTKRCNLFHTRLGNSLVRIQQRLEQNCDRQDEVQTHFQNWQEQWNSQRTTLTRQLEQIESMLGQLVPAMEDVPRLGIVGIHHSGE